MYPYQHPQDERDDKSQNPENKRPAPVFLQIFQIHFQTSQEHDIVDTHFPKKFKTTVAFQNIEPIFPDNNTSQNHTNDMRYAQASQKNRSEKDNHQHKEKYPCGICYRKMYAEIHAFKY